MVAGSAVAGGVLLASATGAGPGKRANAAPASRPLERVTLSIKERYEFRHGNYQLERVVAQTDDKALARFLSDPKVAPELEKATRRVLDEHSCVDLLDGKRLTRLQGRLGDALRDVYRHRTRRQGRSPTVVLFVGVPNDRCRGDCPPATPVCRPPRN